MHQNMPIFHINLKNKKKYNMKLMIYFYSFLQKY